MIDFNKLIEFNMTRNCCGPISYPNVYERDRLVSEFLSLWVKAHTLMTIGEVELCEIDACNIWQEIVDHDPDYSLWDVDFKSTGYGQPVLYFHPLSRYEHPAATFQEQLTRVGKLERWRNPDLQMSNQSVPQTSSSINTVSVTLNEKN